MSCYCVIDAIFSRFREHGDATYIGEPVSQTEHMLQTAHFAEIDGAGATLVAAALLHDFGHLIHDLPEDSAEHGIDTQHEELGYRFLERYFPDTVVQPVRMHVAAKRYLCAIDPAYRDALSAASILSLDLQGGPMDEAEIKAFVRSPHADDAVRLRKYDDMGKIPGADVPDLEHYRGILEEVMR